MTEWILAENLHQREIEDRLRFFHFINNGEQINKEDKAEDSCNGRTYKEAVDGEIPGAAGAHDAAEAQRLYDLCVQPAPVLSLPRTRKEEEDKAVLMILNHELEIPYS
ncbi:hypothetical protein PC129_g4904 [Phytophthora cactorum]|uniref:Uncharacterized protein n=1 Tax=Phytophthora cactorum TaxID=29920 RepID=A0A329SDB1_9STRA|nr:hypothetical protein Pcac1_g1833 [Phytophthora cactorum]KAG2791756.1 hypothetical protein PC111_g23773 [Phytophthora cactorum]KAG2792546.1 hypothetical protein PC112_g23822 [Phytophthora cactorum]KAG2861731.1 hypothetical protein PC113_g6909 [Phytophthora cactorum]KAG2872074.1 hypothetical protein PC114_g26578 [Phytophthora cactorum]